MARQYDIFYAGGDLSGYSGTTARHLCDVRDTGFSPIRDFTLNGAQKLSPWASRLVINTPTSASLTNSIMHVGQRFILTDATTGAKAHLELVRPYFPSSNALTLRPVYSAADVVDPLVLTSVSRTYATGSALAMSETWSDACTICVDLTEAPDDPRGYTYCVTACGWVNYYNSVADTFNNSVGKIEVLLRGPCVEGDSLTGNEYTRSFVTLGSTAVNSDVNYLSTNATSSFGLYPLDGGIGLNVNAGGIVDLLPGGRYFFHLQFRGAVAYQVTQMHQARIMATRFDRTAATTKIGTLWDNAGNDTGIEGTGTGAATTSQTMASPSEFIYLRTGAGTVPVEQPAMTVGVGCVNVSAVSTTAARAYARARFLLPGASDPESYFTPGSTSDWMAVGAMLQGEGQSLPYSQLRVGTNASVGGLVVSARQGFLATFVPLYLASAAEETLLAVSSATTTSTSTWLYSGMDSSDEGATWNSRAGGITEIESWNGAVGSTTDTFTSHAYARPDSANPAVPSEFGRWCSVQYPPKGGGNDSAYLSSFIFHRFDLAAAYTDQPMSIGVLTPKGVGAVTVRRTSGHSAERLPLSVGSDEAVAVLAYIETGLPLKSGWTQGAGWGSPVSSYTYQISLPITSTDLAPGGPGQLLGGVVGVKRNGIAMVETNKASFDSGQFPLLSWYWNKSTRVLNFRMGGTADASRLPWGDDMTIVAAVPLYFSRSPVDVTGFDGVAVPYEARLLNVPGAGASLSVSDGVVTSGASLGSIELANTDGFFDDLMVRRVVEGHKVELRIGYPRLSTNLQDYDLYQSGAAAVPSGNLTSVSFGLFDRALAIDKVLIGDVISSGKFVAQEGDPVAPKSIADQTAPVVYGRQRRIEAFRITNATGHAQNNEYRFASNKCWDVIKCFISATSRESESMAVVSSATNAALGKVIVLNSVAARKAEPTYDGTVGNFLSSMVPDVLFVDVFGQETVSGDRPLLYAGEILRHLWLNNGTGLTMSEIDTGSLDLIDRRWRARLGLVYDDPNGASPTASTIGNRYFKGLPPGTGGVFARGVAVREAAQSICTSVFAYMKTNRGGRLSVGAADYLADNLISNPSFDDANPQIGGGEDTTTYFILWPWRPINSARVRRRKTARYMGTFGLHLDNAPTGTGVTLGGSRAAIEQPVDMTVAGTYAVTCMAQSDQAGTGNSTPVTKFRLAMVAPDTVETLGDAATLSDTAWTRVTATFQVAFGDTGRGRIRIYPRYATDAADAFATNVFVDTVECFRVVAVLDDTNSLLSSWDFDPELYSRAEVAYDAIYGDERRIRISATDATASFLYLPGEESEAADSQPTAGILAPDMNLYDAPSAAGVATALVSYYSRQRIKAEVSVFGLSSFPVLGDRVLVSGIRRLPEGLAASPIWRVDGIDYAGGTAREVVLTISTQIDPVDRRGINHTS